MKFNPWHSVICGGLVTIVLTAGCGTETKSPNKMTNNSSANDIDKAKKESGKATSAGEKSTETKPDPVPAKPIVSKLPFKDVDPATAKLGTEPGEKIFAAKGVDSAGESFSLKDYEGKVLLIDTWASW